MDEHTKGRKTFSWPEKPQSNEAFEALMSAADSHLASEGLSPLQRPMHLGRLFWEAFKWEGPMLPPKELADLPTCDGPVLMAKAHRWYEQVYGEKLKSDWAIGYAPFRLGGMLWKVRFPVIYGQCRLFIDRNLQNRGNSLGAKGKEATYNVLCSVDELPPGLTERLNDHALSEFWQFYISSYQALGWRESHLVGHDLFDQAAQDYDASVDDVLNRRYAQSRWASAQAVEKMLKAILTLTNVPYPIKGAAGHDLLALAEKLNTAHGVSLHRSIVALAQCSPAVRYGEEPSSEDQALIANHAVVGIIELLMQQRKLETLLTSRQPASAVPRQGT